MICQRELLGGALWAESEGLLMAGWRDYEPFPGMPMDVDREGYERLEQNGLLRVYTARLEEMLAGYAVFFVCPSMRRRTKLIATQDVVHVMKGTGPRLAMALLRYAEACLKDEGVDLVYHSSPMEGQLGRALHLLGYRQVGHLYAKQL